jgi:hypothetical protein
MTANELIANVDRTCITWVATATLLELDASSEYKKACAGLVSREFQREPQSEAYVRQGISFGLLKKLLEHHRVEFVPDKFLPEFSHLAFYNLLLKHGFKQRPDTLAWERYKDPEAAAAKQVAVFHSAIQVGKTKMMELAKLAMLPPVHIANIDVEQSGEGCITLRARGHCPSSISLTDAQQKLLAQIKEQYPGRDWVCMEVKSKHNMGGVRELELTCKSYPKISLEPPVTAITKAPGYISGSTFSSYAVSHIADDLKYAAIDPVPDYPIGDYSSSNNTKKEPAKVVVPPSKLVRKLVA